MDDTNTLATLTGLLKQPTPVIASDKRTTLKCEAESNQGCTVFDVSEGDRYRILKLVEDLLDAQDDADKLRQKLHEEKNDFKEKRSALMRKLDQLSEKHEKTLSDYQLLKERYANNLKSLEDKISIVSDKLESSVMEIKELRKANEELLQENVTLKTLNTENAAVLASCQEENSRISLQLDIQKEKEKCYKKQLKKVVSEFKSGAGDNYRFKSSSTSNTEEVRPRTFSVIANQTKDIVDKRSGAGDFITDLSTSTSSLETIKAPTKVIFDKSNQPTIYQGNGEAKSVVEVPLTETLPKYSLDCRDHANDVEDTILLESLFFRF